MTRDFIFWEVDVQRDFMLPEGKLYVPGAERLLPNIRRLTDAARRGEVFLVSSGDFHTPDDPEFQQFPPHCVQGTAGAELLPEALTDNFVHIENRPGAHIPPDLSRYQQLVLEKQTLDVFASLHANQLLERLGTHPEFVVFGVATEYCIVLAAKGLLERSRKVAIVRDAIATLDAAVGDKALADLQRAGARLITTHEILTRLAAVHA